MTEQSGRERERADQRKNERKEGGGDFLAGIYSNSEELQPANWQRGR